MEKLIWNIRVKNEGYNKESTRKGRPTYKKWKAKWIDHIVAETDDWKEYIRKGKTGKEQNLLLDVLKESRRYWELK